MLYSIQAQILAFQLGCIMALRLRYMFVSSSLGCIYFRVHQHKIFFDSLSSTYSGGPSPIFSDSLGHIIRDSLRNTFWHSTVRAGSVAGCVVRRSPSAPFAPSAPSVSSAPSPPSAPSAPSCAVCAVRAVWAVWARKQPRHAAAMTPYLPQILPSTSQITRNSVWHTFQHYIWHQFLAST